MVQHARQLSEADKLCTLCAGVFFMAALLTGIWKWRGMATSKTGQAPRYVDVAHRSSLLYAFAALLLGRFSSLNDYTPRTNTLAVTPPLIFFGLAIGSYILHGALGDTTNQIAKPRLGSHPLPGWATPLFMGSLVAAEVGGFGVLLFGYIEAAYYT